MAKITIFWTSYKPIIPDIIEQEIFNEISSSSIKKLVTVKFIYWKLFRFKILFISFVILFSLGGIYNWFPNFGWKAELIGILFIVVFLIAISVLINLIISSISYINCFIESKQYEKKLNRALANCLNYKSFCNSMSGFDKRYVMHIQRMINEKKSLE